MNEIAKRRHRGRAASTEKESGRRSGWPRKKVSEIARHALGKYTQGSKGEQVKIMDDVFFDAAN